MLDLPSLVLNASARLSVVAMLVVMALHKQVVILCGKTSSHNPMLALFLTTSFRAVGAVAVTVPTCWYLLSNAPDTAHGHGDHGDSHGKEHDEEHAESKDEPEEESKDEGEDKEASSDAEDKDSEKSEDSDSSDDEKKEPDTPDTSDDEGDDEKGGNTKKHIPDAKGGAKKRIESTNAVTAGEKDSSDVKVR